MMRRATRNRLLLRILPVLSVIAVVIAWQAIVSLLQVPSIVLPSPADVLEAFRSKARELAYGTGATAIRVVIGFAISTATALPLAIIVVQSPTIGRYVQPLITLSQAVPKVALAPIVVLWFGNGTLSQTAFAAIAAFFPIFIEAVVGLRAIEPEMIMLSRTMGSSVWQTYVKFRMPRALPHLFAGLKVGATLAVVGAVVAEWIGGENGIALILLQADALLQTSLAIAALIILAALGGAFYALIALAEMALSPRRTAQGATYS